MARRKKRGGAPTRDCFLAFFYDSGSGGFIWYAVPEKPGANAEKVLTWQAASSERPYFWQIKIHTVQKPFYMI